MAVALLELRGLGEDDFALFHPGGTLGRRLLFRVRDLMHSGEAVPVVPETALMQEVILEMTGKRFGATSVVNRAGVLTGIITDGDLRRHLQKDRRLFDRRARDVMTSQPKTIGADELATKALELMEHHAITSLLIVEEGGRPAGIIHLHDLLRAKIA